MKSLTQAIPSMEIFCLKILNFVFFTLHKKRLYLVTLLNQFLWSVNKWIKYKSNILFRKNSGAVSELKSRFQTFALHHQDVIPFRNLSRKVMEGKKFKTIKNTPFRWTASFFIYINSHKDTYKKVNEKCTSQK